MGPDLEFPLVLSNFFPHLLLYLLCTVHSQTQGLSEGLSVKSFITQVSAVNIAFIVMPSAIQCAIRYRMVCDQEGLARLQP